MRIGNKTYSHLVDDRFNRRSSPRLHDLGSRSSSPPLHRDGRSMKSDVVKQQRRRGLVRLQGEFMWRRG
jgi:hypothetical protein